VDYAGNDTFPASLELPDDGDDRDAAGVDVPLEALADRTVYLRNVGWRRTSQWVHDSESPVASWSFNSAAYAPNTTDANAWLVTITNVRAGDVLVLDALVPLSGGASQDGFVRFGVTQGFGSGGVEATAPGFARIGPSASAVMSLSTTITATTPGPVRVRLLGKIAGGDTFAAVAFGALRATLLRPSGSFA
jgi:hypothetical protein